MLQHYKRRKESLQDLRKDDSHMVLIADKGVVDKGMYTEKCMALLNDEV